MNTYFVWLHWEEIIYLKCCFEFDKMSKTHSFRNFYDALAQAKAPPPPSKLFSVIYNTESGIET